MLKLYLRSLWTVHSSQPVNSHCIYLMHFNFSAMFSRIMSTGSQFVMEGVKNLVIGTKVRSLITSAQVLLLPWIYFFNYFLH